MYIVLFALLYILLMMVVTAGSVFKGLMVLLFGGGLIALVVYILDSPRRARSNRNAEQLGHTDQADQADTGAD